MERFVAGTTVALEIPFVDASGQSVSTPTSVNFEILDGAGQQVSSGASPVAPEAVAFTVTLGSTETALAPGVIRDIRQIRITYVSDGQTRQGTRRILIESADPLVIGDNSFQTYNMALVTASAIERVNSFNDAPEQEQIAALESAYRAICSLRFLVEDRHYPDLGRLTPAEWATLPVRFKQALQQAQVIEANESLDPNSTWRRRQDGYFSETVGESSIAFRPGRLLMTPVSRRSLNLLSRWLNWNVGLRRE